MGGNGEYAPACSVKYKNVLIARFSALGDVALGIPIVYSVCVSNPDTRFIMVTQPVASTLFINAPANLTVEAADVKREYTGISGIVRLKKRLVQKYPIDAFIDLHDEPFTWVLVLLFRMSGIPCERLNKGRSGKRALTRKHNKRMFPLISAMARYREVFHRMGLSFNDSFESIYGELPATGPVEDFASLAAPKRPGETWIAIAPFAKYTAKMYPLDLMETVVAEIARWEDTRIFLFGVGDEERRVFAQWASRYPSVTTLAERRNGFHKELALLSHCDVMLTMDSVNMHLASLVRVPVVSVWGATHPYCGFMGWHQSERNAVQLNMSCRPCSVTGNKPCANRDRDYYCLRGISPQLILSHLAAVLNRKV